MNGVMGAMSWKITAGDTGREHVGEVGDVELFRVVDWRTDGAPDFWLTTTLPGLSLSDNDYYGQGFGTLDEAKDAARNALVTFAGKLLGGTEYIALLGLLLSGPYTGQQSWDHVAKTTVQRLTSEQRAALLHWGPQLIRQVEQCIAQTAK